MQPQHNFVGVLIPRLGNGQEAKAVLAGVAKAMGDVKMLQYTGSGSTSALGQSPSPETPWPRFNAKSYSRSVNYDTASRRAGLQRVLLGHDRYYDAVPRNGKLLRGFRDTSRRYWCQTRRRRRQRHRMPWPRMYALAGHWLPTPHIVHPYPAQRLRVTTRGKSPVR